MATNWAYAGRLKTLNKKQKEKKAIQEGSEIRNLIAKQTNQIESMERKTD